MLGRCHVHKLCQGILLSRVQLNGTHLAWKNGSLMIWLKQVDSLGCACSLLQEQLLLCICKLCTEAQDLLLKLVNLSSYLLGLFSLPVPESLLSPGQTAI